MKREPVLELLRCVLMFGIVVEHVVGQCAYIVHGADFLTDWCVCGFVFLSAWFGVRFSWLKVARLVALGMWCALVSNLLGGVRSPLEAVRGVCGYWFLWAYVVLMMFAPVIDGVVDACVSRCADRAELRACLLKIVSPFMILQWGWSVVMAVPVVRDYVPHPFGLDGRGFASLVIIYLFVRVYRVLDISRYFSVGCIMFVIPVCVGAMLCGFWSYQYLPAFIVSATAFEWFRRRSLPCWVSRAVLFVAPSMFSIYLLHLQLGGGLRLMSQFERWCHEVNGLPLGLTFVFTSIVTFAVCLFLDLLRRGGLCLFEIALSQREKRGVRR